jgi:4-aminobutyrate aminotransferase / (S)-3-amino-2-methylpropionate transaminase / 5-aminovalerate transaminase
MDTQELMGLRMANVPRGVFNYFPAFAAHAKNAVIVDVNGRELIDFAGGIGCTNVGHCHPKVVAAVQRQAERFSHTSFNVVMYEPYVRLAEKLNRLTPGDFPKKTMFVNSGAEAVENGVKIARHFTGRDAVIAFEGAFHGRTLLGMSLTSKVLPYKTGFGPFAPEIYRIPFAYCYRCPIGLSHPSCGVRCAELLNEAFEQYVEAKAVAAVIVEPVLGEGGFVAPPPEYLRRLKEICEENGIVFICDEIQTGMGRTGKMFAIEHAGVVPDIVLSAKSLGSGYPIAGITGHADIMDSPPPGSIGGTYGGNPVACAAGLAVFEIIEEEGLLARAEAIGTHVRERFAELQRQFPVVGDVRGLGAMIAMELVGNPETKEPAAALAKELRSGVFDRGALCLLAGSGDNVLRLLVPLTIENETLDRGLDIIEESLAAAVGIRVVSADR